MTEPRIGSMFSGYGGLDMAVVEVCGGSVVWFAENNPGACKVLAHHWPEIPNLGDVTAIDWEDVPPVDIIAAGFPCQNISVAGDRKGITGDRSRLWEYVTRAVRAIRPRLVVLENVANIRSKGLDVVTGDMASLGYDTEWICVRASDVGAPHRRDRWFCAATDSDPDGWGWGTRRTGETTGKLESAHGGDGPLELLPTPIARDGKGAGFASQLPYVVRDDVMWREYAPAVRRWEEITGRLAPDPTEPAPRGGRRLSPALPEWMMGIPLGHVTAVPGLSRNAQLRVIGGGVVPRQAVAALRWMAARRAALEANAA